MDFSPLPVISGDSAKNIKTPISIFAAEQNIMFPGKKMINRTRSIFPSLKEAVIIMDSKHLPYKNDFKIIEEIIVNTSNRQVLTFKM